MESNYVITSNGSFVSEELYHHGIRGMKWGVRRYQNPDGSLTANGKKRYLNSDGTLNKKGEKYYAKEKERLKSEKKALSAQKKSNAKLLKLEEMRKKNADLKDEINGKKKNESDSSDKPKHSSELNDKELQDRVNRLRNEDAYRDLNKKLGYDEPKTELDTRIVEMEKQKKYLELQRDIKNLTPQKVSRGKKIMDTLINKVVEPAATEAGKKILSQYLTEAGTKVLGKQAKQAKDTVDKSAERVKQKEAKKETKKEAKKESNKEKVFDGTVEGTGTSSKKDSSEKKSSPIVDAEIVEEYSNRSTTSFTNTRNTSSGSSYVNRYNDTSVSSLPSSNIAGYLPAPKKKDDD